MVEFLVLDVAWYFATVSIIWNLTRNTSLHWIVTGVIGVLLAMLLILATYHLMYMLTSGEKNNGSDEGIIKKTISGFALIVFLFLMLTLFLITIYSVAILFHKQWDWSWLSTILTAIPVTLSSVAIVAVVIVLVSVAIGKQFPLVSRSIYERYHN